jgi:hypothetical protein
MSEDTKKRDSEYRIAALKAAIDRAGQDGGLEGNIDVMALAEFYYAWLTGQIDTAKPLREPIEGEDE